MTVFPIVLGALIVFTVVIFVIARFIVPTPSELAATVDSRVMMMVEKRIEPVGRVRTSPPDETEMAAAAPAGPRSGEDVYNAVCNACHQTGVANAPKFRDTETWAPRVGKGIDGLVASAISGIGTMPPRGGLADASDEEIRSAVEYMVPQ